MAYFGSKPDLVALTLVFSRTQLENNGLQYVLIRLLSNFERNFPGLNLNPWQTHDLTVTTRDLTDETQGLEAKTQGSGKTWCITEPVTNPWRTHDLPMTTHDFFRGLDPQKYDHFWSHFDGFFVAGSVWNSMFSQIHQKFNWSVIDYCLRILNGSALCGKMRQETSCPIECDLEIRHIDIRWMSAYGFSDVVSVYISSSGTWSIVYIMGWCHLGWTDLGRQ